MSSILCKFANCKARSRYGAPNSNVREYCVNHTMDKYIDLTIPMCKVKNCENNATYMLCKELEYCINHRPENYKIGYSICIDANCYYRAIYGLAETNIREYCGKHCDLNIHVDLTDKICTYGNCCNVAKAPRIPYSRHAFCNEHYVPRNESDAKRCIVAKCKCLAYYGVEGGPIQYCIKHHDKNKHISMRGRLCPYKGCKELMVGKEKKCKLNHRLKRGKFVDSSESINVVVDISISTVGANIGANIIADLGITFTTDEAVIDPCAELDKYAILDPIGMDRYLHLESNIDSIDCYFK